MTIHHEPAGLPRPDLDTTSRPWSSGEITMAVIAGALAIFAIAMFYLAGIGP